MKNLSLGIVLSILSTVTLPAQDLVSGGVNSWIFHTPDDGRTLLYVAPGVNQANWDWTKQWRFGADGVLAGNSIELSRGISIIRDLGTSDYTYVGQHQMHLRIRRASDLKAIELGVLDNGVGVLQANEAGVGYNSLALNPVAGNVGVGTISPAAKLDVEGSAAIANSAGINVDSFAGRVVAGGISDGSGWGLSTAIGGNSGVGRSWAIGSNGGDLYMGYQNGSSAMSLQTFLQVSPNRNLYLVPASGNVGIGTTSPTHKLAVNGTVKAKEVIVETSGWSDYVFADGYALAPLAEVEAHIKEHKHLPGIPSAAQVAENGVSIGEMQVRLLAKIEELTLHQIAQQKELAVLKAENAHLRSRVQQLDAR
jgi:hypothetical protein